MNTLNLSNKAEEMEAGVVSSKIAHNKISRGFEMKWISRKEQQSDKTEWLKAVVVSIQAQMMWLEMSSEGLHWKLLNQVL